MKITIEEEKRSALVFLKKKDALYKRALFIKNENNSKKMRCNDKKALNDSKLDVLYDKVICGLVAVSSVMENDETLITINILSLLLDFAYIDLKFTDKQLTSLLLYSIRRNLEINVLEFFDRYYVNLHNVIKRCFFDKQDTNGMLIDFTCDDVNEIKLALENIDIHKKIKPKIIKTLESMATKLETTVEENIVNSTNGLEREKKKKKDYTNLQSISEVFRAKTPEPVLSIKDYFRINNELLEYFSFNYDANSVEELNNSIIIDKPLCATDRMHCIKLMKEAKYEFSTIKTFLEKTYIHNKVYMNTLQFYNEIYEMLFDLLNNENNEYYYLETYLKDINDTMLEMQFADKSTYRFGKELIKSIIDDMLDTIPKEKATTYYLKKAKVLKKK